MSYAGLLMPMQQSDETVGIPGKNDAAFQIEIHHAGPLYTIYTRVRFLLSTRALREAGIHPFRQNKFSALHRIIVSLASGLNCDIVRALSPKKNELIPNRKTYKPFMKTFRLAITIALLVFSSLHLLAAELYWDPTQSAGTALGGSGNWDQVSSNWFNGTDDLAWTNANNDDAIFSGTAGTSTLTENISAGNVYFTNVTGNYFITNATGAEVLTLGGVIDTGGGEHTIGAPISNSTTLNKNGAGRLHLPVDNSATLTGTVAINEGDVSVENNNGAGQTNPITVADGAALVLNGGVAGLTVYPTNLNINGSGITNSGALRNLSGVTTLNGQVILGENNSMIYVDSGGSLVFNTNTTSALTDRGSNYNLVLSASGTGNVHLGSISIGGTLIVEGPASCYSYLIGVTPTTWTSTYITAGGTFYTEAANSFGTASASTTNCILDGGTIVAGGTFTSPTGATEGITVTTNGGTLTNTTGTWTTQNIYSQGNTGVTLTGAGSYRPGGAAGSINGTINLGSGTFIKSGSGDCNMTYANPTNEIYSNLVVSGGSFSFNYDQGGATAGNFGTYPSSLNTTNITLSGGGSLHAGHTTTIGANRGIYLGSGGGSIEDVVSSGGTVTVNGPVSGPGNLTCPNGHAGVTTGVTLTANNSYAGTTINSGALLTIGSGGSTGTLGTGNTSDSGVLAFNRTGSYSYGGVISGSGSVTKAGSGTVTLTGANTYSSNTTVSAGTLLVNNTSGSGTGTGSVAINSGGTLGGSGTISGAVTVASGGTLALGLSTLTMNNGLSLAGNVTVSLNKSLTPSNGTAVVSGTLTRTGTGSVTVTNLGPALIAGDTFQLFSQAVSGGGTMTISGGGTGVVWTNNLAANGTISVLSVTLPTPHITQVQISSGNIILSGTNGPANGTYYVLSSTNVTLPLNQWTSLSTNSFNASGQFSVTNAITPGLSQQFFSLEVP